MRFGHCIGASLVCLVLTFAFAGDSTPPPTAASPSAVQSPSAPPGITDEQIGISIDRAAKFLLSKFDAKGALQPIDGITGQADHDGLEALCIYALLEAGRANFDPKLDPRDPLMRKLMLELKRCPMRTDPNVPAPVTMARSFRALALSVYDRPEDREALNADVKWLLRAHRDGAYMYDDSWPNEQVVAQAPPQNSGPPIIITGTPPGSGVYVGGSQKTFSSQPQNFKTNNTYVNHQANNTYINHQANNTYINHQQNNFYTPQLPNNFYYAADRCIPNKGKAIASSGIASAGTRQLPPTTQPQTDGVQLPPAASGVAMGFSDPEEEAVIHRSIPADQSPSPWDNSDSQFGAFAVYTAAQNGIDIPGSYWQAVDGHWVRCQQDDGQWGYSESDPDPRVSMTCAGLASFFVTYDRLGGSVPANKLGNPALTPRMQKSMDWLEQSDNSVTMLGPLTHYVSYNMFTLERVGLDSGYKFFGTHDWYREMAGRVIPVQWPNGAFGRNVDGYDTIVESAFTLLFLSRGRSPVMMEKLKFDGDWSNRPRDLANATRFASKALERPLNWEVVPLNRDWTDWLDSPLMYIASDQPPNFSDADIAKLRNYINAGGTIFTHADGGSKAFNDYIETTLASKLFPQSPMQSVPMDDPIYSTQYPLSSKTATPLLGIRNGSRWVLVHSPNDLSLSWQNRAEKASPQNFQLATNLFVYAAGKDHIRNRIAPMATPIVGPTTAP